VVRVRLSDLQNKDIVNTIDGRNVGNIIDVKIDQINGAILSLVVEPNKKMISFMNRGVEEEISWKNIERIGEDVILVRLE
jgi:sporulation protein, ylmC/ymxH family